MKTINLKDAIYISLLFVLGFLLFNQCEESKIAYGSAERYKQGKEFSEAKIAILSENIEAYQENIESLTKEVIEEQEKREKLQSDKSKLQAELIRKNKEISTWKKHEFTSYLQERYNDYKTIS